MNTDTLRLTARTLPASPFLGAWTRALPPLLALAGAAAVYGLAVSLLPRDGRIAALLLDRGFCQPLTLALFFWGMGHALRRLLVQTGERQALEACRTLLVEGLDRDQIANHAGALFPIRDSLAAPVLGSILNYFRNARPSRDEVLKVAEAQLDRAYDRIESEYKALSAVMWLLPLTGFLGTVFGMAQAIEGMEGVIGAGGADLASLTPTVNGLAIAFDTTLLALVLVLPLKLVEVALEARDRRLLDRIDATVGAGLVGHLDLGTLAQQTPEERALDRVNESVERMERNLRRVDEALGRVATRMAEAAAFTDGLGEVVEAARATRRALPEVQGELRKLREQGEQPMTVVRTRRGEEA
jgi:biopolymer transport protein ExbB/TolQ